MIKRTKGLTFYIVEIPPGMYVWLIRWVHCLLWLILNITSARVCDVGGHNICLGSMRGWWIHMPIGNWIVAVFHNILIIGNAYNWNLMLLILLCLGWGNRKWNSRWWLVLAPLGSGPIFKGWFGGGWLFFSHGKVLLFLLQMQMTWHVWLF